MSTLAYKCPCCGSFLNFNGNSGKMECTSCSNQFDLDVIKSMYEQKEQENIHFDLPDDSYQPEEVEQIKAYTCKSCGAELLTEETTTATECPYCGSPTILPDRFANGCRPEKVIPFTVKKEEAQKQFEDYFKGKRLLPNIFLKTKNRIAQMRKLYVPYWLFDCDAEGDMVYDAEKRHKRRVGDWEIETTEHYLVRRSGKMRFENIPVDGSAKLDNKISESLEPYKLEEAIDFQPAVLSGAMADNADVDAKDCETRAVERVETSLKSEIRNSVRGYDSVSERSHQISTNGGKATAILMPVWLITTEKEGKTYTFAINGQTGKLTCDVPADTKKSLLWGGGVFAGVFGLAALILKLMDMLGSGTLLIAALAGLIAAFAVVGVMIGQLKQASFQTEASDYVTESGCEILHRGDHFLYAETKRRKIETEEKK